MKSVGTLTALGVILYHCALLGQTNNPYPTEIGDTWEYMTFDALSGTKGAVRNTVLSRALHSNGMYLITYSNARQIAYDSSGYVYWIDSSDSLNLWFNFNAAQGEVYGSDGKEMTVDSVYSTIVFDSVRTVYRFSIWWGGAHTGLRMGSWTVAEKIGILLTESFEPDYYYEALTGAIIDGQDYGQTLGADNNESNKPTHFHLAQNYPNPFNPTTTIQYTLNLPQHVTLVATDLYGREVRRMLDASLEEAGTHQISFDATGLPSGVYFYSLVAGRQRLTKKMVLLR